MDYLWISDFFLLCFQFLYISTMHTAEWVTTIRNPEEKAVNISCRNTSKIQIQNISVQEEATSCGPNQCVLSSNDTHTIEDNCNGVNSCLVDYNFTSACLRVFRYMNLSYTCKHENGTSLNTFEENYGDWVNVFTNNFNWKRTAGVEDHTGARCYSIRATSSFNTTGNARIHTVKEFREPVCFSLWYQLYSNSNDCSLSIYKTYNGNQTRIFTTDGKSTSSKTWNKISVDVYDKVPFKLTLEANFYYSNAKTVRSILVDETSIAYRPCKGQRIDTTCQDIDTPIAIECETQFLSGDIKLTFQQENPTIHQTECQEKSIERELNTFCRVLEKSDQCKFTVSDFMNKYEDCNFFNKNISVTYECINNSQTTIAMEISTDSRFQSEDTRRGFWGFPVKYNIIVIVAGVSGGVLVTVIAVVVICRIKRSATDKKGAISSNASKSSDELQYDDKSQLNPTLSKCSGQDKISNANSKLYTPKKLDQGGQELADLYNISNEDGTYDVSSNKKQLKPHYDSNIYSHTADNIYDSGSHHKLTDRNEETYDHFFGKQTEDEYDTTTLK